MTRLTTFSICRTDGSVRAYGCRTLLSVIARPWDGTDLGRKVARSPPSSGPGAIVPPGAPTRKSGLRRVPSPVAPRKEQSRRRTRTLRPSFKPFHMLPEACGRLDGFSIVTNRAVEELLADLENPCTPLIVAGAATRRWITPPIQVR